MTGNDGCAGRDGFAFGLPRWAGGSERFEFAAGVALDADLIAYSLASSNGNAVFAAEPDPRPAEFKQLPAAERPFVGLEKDFGEPSPAETIQWNRLGGEAQQMHLRIGILTALAAGGLWLVFGSPAAGPIVHATARANFSKESIALLEQTGEIFGRVSDVVAPAVVYIEAKQRDKKGELYTEESGSGIIVRPDDLGRPVIVTNLHVVANAKPEEVEIILADGRVLTPTRILSDRDTDLAVLATDAADLPSARIGESDEVHVGQWVLAIGSPFGLMQSVTHGIVSAKDRRQLGLPQSMRIKEFIQTDAAINPGSSGGPLVNLQAEVVGVNTAIASHTGGSSGVGFAIPSNIVRRVVSELTKYGRVRRAFLGVEFPRSFDHEKALELGLPVARGALISGVPVNTPAQSAGVRTGDVVLEFAGRAVEDENHLINLVSATEVGKTVRLTIWRERQRIAIEVVLGDWNEYQAGK